MTTSSPELNPEKITPLRPPVRCGTCATLIFDGEAIRSRVVLLDGAGARAKCRQCKGWVSVPVGYRT